MSTQTAIVCPHCGAKPKVIDSRGRGSYRYRRSECPSCKKRWATYELSVPESGVLDLRLPNSLKDALIPMIVEHMKNSYNKQRIQQILL